jgi:hypothetical protein
VIRLLSLWLSLSLVSLFLSLSLSLSLSHSESTAVMYVRGLNDSFITGVIFQFSWGGSHMQLVRSSSTFTPYRAHLTLFCYTVLLTVLFTVYSLDDHCPFGLVSNHRLLYR